MENKTIQEVLGELDACLRAKRTDYYSQLQEGLSEPEIEALEQQYGRQIPDDLRALYRWKNGQKARCYEAFVNNQMFMPLAVILRSAQLFTGMIGYDFEIENWWNAHWLPVWSNGGGSHICYDAQGTFTGQPGQVLEYWKSDNDRNVIAPSLTDFLDRIVQYYQQTDPDDFDEYFEIDLAQGYPKRFVLD